MEKKQPTKKAIMRQEDTPNVHALKKENSILKINVPYSETSNVLEGESEEGIQSSIMGELTTPTSTEEMITRDYASFYPDNHKWYVTSDNMVFLSDGEQLALSHQETINTSKCVVKEVLTIKTK